MSCPPDGVEEWRLTNAVDVTDRRPHGSAQLITGEYRLFVIHYCDFIKKTIKNVSTCLDDVQHCRVGVGPVGARLVQHRDVGVGELPPKVESGVRNRGEEILPWR